MKPVLPGQFPFKRGVDPLGYREKPCSALPLAGFGEPSAVNQELRMLASSGADGVWLRVDVHPGAVLRTAADLTTILQGLDLTDFAVYFVAQESAAPVTALWMAATRELGYDPARLPGGVSNDVLGDTIFGDGVRVDIETALDLIAWAAGELPAFLALIPGAVPRESGIGAAFELAALMSSVREYLGRLREKNLAGHLLPDRLHVVLPAAGAGILDEIAKFRAARVLYATYLREKEGITDGRIRLHAWTQDSLLAPVQTDVNLVRVALGTLAAVLGGAESVTAAPSEIPPDLFDQRTALRTAQILLHETGIPLTADPCGGSEAIEERTAAISADAYSMVERDSKWMRAEYRRRVEEERRRIARGERVVVGVNRFAGEREKPALRPAPAAARQPAQTHAVESALAKVEARARDRVNVMPALVEAATAGATLPAMLSTLRRGRMREAR